MSDPFRLRIFLSSPGDVVAERQLTRDVFEKLRADPSFRERINLDLVAWDDPNASTPLPAHITPQLAISRGLPLPSGCDIVIVILWSRLGTPLPPAYKKPDGTPYRSGTEWEYCDALHAARKSGKPEILLYRRTEIPTAPLDVPDIDERRQQLARVNAFFEEMKNADGSLSGGVQNYNTTLQFSTLLEQHLRSILVRLLETSNSRGVPFQAPPHAALASTFQATADSFRESYLSADGKNVPFGGRDAELSLLDNWLDDSAAAPRFLLVAPTALGKSALLVRWLDRLEKTGRIGSTSDQWQLVFLPISLRFDTRRPEIFYQAVAAQLARIVNEATPMQMESAGDYADKCSLLCKRAVELGRRVLIVLDGIDEAVGNTFDASWFPSSPGSCLRLVLSARLFGDDVDERGWRERLGWDERRTAHCMLRPLGNNQITDLVRDSAAEGLADRPEIIDRLHVLTSGEPLLLNLYIQDIRALGERGGDLTVSFLNGIAPGFAGWFRRWYSRQKEAWAIERGSGEIIIEERLNAFLAVFTCAFGALTVDEIAEVVRRAHGFDPTAHMDQFLRPLRRFLMGRGADGKRGFVFNHPKFAEFFLADSFLPRSLIAQTSRAFCDWGLEKLDDLDNGRRETTAAPSYVVQFLRLHLEQSQADVDVCMRLCSESWLRAWEKLEGDYRGFTADIRWLADVVEKSGRSDRKLWSNRLRCQLVLASLRNVGANIPTRLLAAAVAHGLVGVHLAFYYLDFKDERVRALGLLDLHKFLEPEEQVIALAEVQKAIDSSTPGHWRGDLIARLAPHLPEEQRHDMYAEVIENFDATETLYTAYSGLIDAARHLPQSFMPVVLARAIRFAELNGERYWWVVAEVIWHCPAELRARLLRDEIPDIEGLEGNALAFLAPYVARPGDDQFNRGLDAARALVDGDLRAKALSGYIPELEGNQREAIISIAASAALERPSISSFGSLLRVLQEDERTGLVESAIAEGRISAKSLGDVAEWLPLPLIRTAFEASKEIGGEDDRAAILAALLPFLPEAERQSAAEELESFCREFTSRQPARAARLLGEVGNLLNEPVRADLVTQVFEVLRGDGLGNHWQLVASVANQLSVAQMREVLDFFLLTSNKNVAGHVLTELALQVPEGWHAELHSFAEVDASDFDRSRILKNLVIATKGRDERFIAGALSAVADWNGSTLARTRAEHYLALIPYLRQPLRQQIIERTVADITEGVGYSQLSLVGKLLRVIDETERVALRTDLAAIIGGSADLAQVETPEFHLDTEFKRLVGTQRQGVYLFIKRNGAAIAAVGGPAEISRIRQAVRDTAVWFP